MSGPRMRQLIAPLMLCMGITACSEHDLSDLKAYVVQVNSHQKRAIAPLPEVKPVETFVFNPEGLRDPFTPSVDDSQKAEEINAGNGLKPNFGRPKEALEAYSLDSLRMVGTVDKAGTLWGLIRAGDGTIHRARPGHYMGGNHGRITRIMEGRIELLEIIPDGPNSWRERQASLTLAE